VKDGKEADSDEDVPGLEHPDKKLNKGEKKCRKALEKIGMKKVTGITRVTLKKRDGIVFAINDPEVLKSSTNENSFVVFGELKLEDHNQNQAKEAVQQFKNAEKPTTAAPTATAAPTEEIKKEDEKVEENVHVTEEEPLSEEGLTVMHIDMVMQHANCTRNQAIRALKEANDDMVNAIMRLTK